MHWTWVTKGCASVVDQDSHPFAQAVPASHVSVLGPRLRGDDELREIVRHSRERGNPGVDLLHWTWVTKGCASVVDQDSPLFARAVPASHRARQPQRQHGATQDYDPR